MIFRPQRGWQFLNKKQKRSEFWKYYSNVVIVKMDYNPVWIYGLKAGIRVRWQSTQGAKCWHSLLPYSHLIHKITKFKIFVLLVIIPTCLSFKLRSFLFDFVHQPSAASIWLFELSSAAKFFKIPLVQSSNFPSVLFHLFSSLLLFTIKLLILLSLFWPQSYLNILKKREIWYTPIIPFPEKWRNSILAKYGSWFFAKLSENKVAQGRLFAISQTLSLFSWLFQEFKTLCEPWGVEIFYYVNAFLIYKKKNA